MLLRLVLWNALLVLLVAANKPARVVSCSLATDEMAVELLDRAKALGRLKAVSKLADHPSYSNLAQLPPGIEARCSTEVESLLALRPDLALLAPYNKPDIIRQIEAARIRTLILEDPRTLEAVAANLLALGRALGEEAAAQTLVAEFAGGRARLAQGAPTLLQGRRVKLLHVFPDGAVSGQDTMFDALAKEVGAENVAATLGVKGWPKLTTEVLAQLTPDLVVAASEPAARARTLDALRSMPGIRDIAAVRAGRLVVIPERELGTVSHHVIKAVERLRSALTELAATPAPRASTLPSPPLTTAPATREGARP